MFNVVIGFSRVGMMRRSHNTTAGRSIGVALGVGDHRGGMRASLWRVSPDGQNFPGVFFSWIRRAFRLILPLTRKPKRKQCPVESTALWYDTSRCVDEGVECTRHTRRLTRISLSSRLHLRGVNRDVVRGAKGQVRQTSAIHGGGDR